jgi:hypothetical protein
MLLDGLVYFDESLPVTLHRGFTESSKVCAVFSSAISSTRRWGKTRRVYDPYGQSIPLEREEHIDTKRISTRRKYYCTEHCRIKHTRPASTISEGVKVARR